MAKKLKYDICSVTEDIESKELLSDKTRDVSKITFCIRMHGAMFVPIWSGTLRIGTRKTKTKWVSHGNLLLMVLIK